MYKPWDAQTEADVELVTRAYNQCALRWGWFKRLLRRRVHPLARRLYIVVRATESVFQDGLVRLLEDERFELSEMAESFEALGLDSYAQVIREFNRRVGEPRLSKNRGKRWRQLEAMDISQSDLEELHDHYYSHPEEEVYRRLAQVIRQHPEAFVMSDP